MIFIIPQKKFAQYKKNYYFCTAFYSIMCIGYNV